MKRRVLFRALSSAATACITEASAAPADRGSSAAAKIIDCNVNLFHWPFRRLPLDETDALVEKLRSLHVEQAWACTFEGILHRDLAEANARLAAVCRESGAGILRPVGSINPMLPGWQDDLERCREEHGMNAIRLHPNYHGYTVQASALSDVLTLAGDRKLLVQLTVSLEDTRTQHPAMQADDVDLKLLRELLQRHPQTRVMLLNHKPSPAITPLLAETPNLYFDIARTEGTDGVARLLKMVPPERVVFGSHAPFFIPEAALIRVEESWLDAGLSAALLRGNALNILA